MASKFHFGSLCNFKLSKRGRIWKHTTKDETDNGPPKKVKPPDVKKQNINTDKKRLSNNNQKKKSSPRTIQEREPKPRGSHCSFSTQLQTKHIVVRGNPRGYPSK